VPLCDRALCAGPGGGAPPDFFGRPPRGLSAVLGARPRASVDVLVERRGARLLENGVDLRAQRRRQRCRAVIRQDPAQIGIDPIDQILAV
jgi:hypothetical protein